MCDPLCESLETEFGQICPRSASTNLKIYGKVPGPDACKKEVKGWTVGPKKSTADLQQLPVGMDLGDPSLQTRLADDLPEGLFIVRAYALVQSSAVAANLSIDSFVKRIRVLCRNVDFI